MRPSHRAARGQTVVEVALILPIFVLLLVGIFDLGRAVYASSTINNAAREAGRLAIVDQTLVQIQAEAIKQSVALGLTASDVSVDYREAKTPNRSSSCATVIIGCIADVRVTYTFTAATPLIDLLVGHITLVGETKFAVEAICVEPTQAACPAGS
jgi:Flp pilus assembly protein TadG